MAALCDRIADLERLLEVQERVVAEQSDKRRLLVERLKQSEANFKALVEELPDAVFVHQRGLICYVNPCMLRLLGHDNADALIGRPAMGRFIHPDDRERLLAYQRESEASGPSTALRIRWLRQDGTVRIVEGTRTPIIFDGGPAILVRVRDVTEQLRVAEEMRHSEERYRLLFEQSPLAKVVFEPASLQILAVNDTACRVYGYSVDELTALRLTDLKPPDDHPEIVRGMAQVREQGSKSATIWRGIRKHRRKDGALIDMEISAHPVTLDGRTLMLATFNDVTQRLRLEEQLRQAQKMDAVGQLAGGIAHDFNNILAVVLAGADLALGELPEGHHLRPELAEIERAAKRAASLTQQLLTFSRQQPVQPRVLALNSIVSNMGKMLKRVLGEDVAMWTVLAPDLAWIKADPGHVEQILLNLAVNARDAMPRGGKLTIETANVELDGSAAASVGVAEGRYAMLAISDSGCGMDVATLGRIFEPFFTTKEVGKGTGLGLATVFGIVKQSGGGISVYSEVSRGTTFKIYFPCLSAPPRSVTPQPSRLDVTTGSETVLVVEDDDQVRGVVRRLLAARGYTVVEAASPQAGLEALGERGVAVDLVVTDLVMPEMDGREMIARMHARRPDLKVLFMSGYTEHAAVRGDAFEPGENFIQKPFTVQDMARAVRRALGRTTSTPP